MKKIKIKIDGHSFEAKEGETVWQVAKRNKIEIPNLCYHADFPAKGNCRVCVVEVKGWRKLVTSCSTLAQDGMEIFSNSPKVKKSRNTNLELIFAEHIEKCPTCIWRLNCPLLEYAKRYELSIKRYQDRKGKRKTYKFYNSVEIDGSQCIDCRNCLNACSLQQNINFLELKGKGIDQEIVPTKNKDIACIQCGQCALHCPVSAAQEQADWDGVENIIKNKKGKVVIAQFAPSVRVTIGEEFGLPYGKAVAGQIVSALKQLGFDYVFDVNFSADVTTMVEAKELLERVKTGGVLPMITSCCPGWVNYLEFYRPDLIPHLTTSRSPHIHGGGLIKTYWAEKMKIDPKDIIVVSVMPCTAKKFERAREEMKVNGHFPVDVVITTRELAWMIKRNNIDFAKLKPTPSDDPLGVSSGAAAIYGGSGGVMESALRTASFLACGGKNTKLCQSRLEFKDVRGLNSLKETVVSVAGKKLRVAVVNGIGNIKKVLENLSDYDYIEVMACVGGCIGGGGQPIPTNQEIRKKRVESLYKIDKDSKLRVAHKNKPVLEVLDWLEKQKGGLEHRVLHTHYLNRRKNKK